MNNSLTATYHTIDLNLLSPDKFEHFCFWLVDDSAEYKTVEYYGGPGDKGRDVIGYTYDDDLDYFQCKRRKDLNYSLLKTELDGIASNVKEEKIKPPRRICFVLSSSVSPDAKDKLKQYARRINLPEPNFWEPIILDKKVKNNPQALKNFFNISKKREENLPQVDVDELIATGTQESRFMVVNNGDIPAVDCSWQILGFAWNGYPGTPTVFSLKPQEKRELRIAMPVDFMKKNPIKELRIRFKYRDGRNNWYYSERFLNVEMVNSGAFFRIHPQPGKYVPAQALIRFSIDSIELLPLTGLRKTRLATYSYNSKARNLVIEISSTLPATWQFNNDELEYAFKELAERKIMQMIRSSRFENKFVVNIYLKPTQKTGFEAYKELRESVS